MVSGNNKILLKKLRVQQFFLYFLAAFAIYPYFCSVIKNK